MVWRKTIVFVHAAKVLIGRILGMHAGWEMLLLIGRHVTSVVVIAKLMCWPVSAASASSAKTRRVVLRMLLILHPLISELGVLGEGTIVCIIIVIIITITRKPIIVARAIVISRYVVVTIVVIVVVIVLKLALFEFLLLFLLVLLISTGC